MHMQGRDSEVYKSVLKAAKGRLLEAIPTKGTPKKLTQLLELNFAYVGLPQLRDIPLQIWLPSDVSISVRHARRAEVYKSVLEAAKGRLLEAIPKMSPEKLTQLLELSFAYVGLPQLRDIPLAVLGQLQPVPAAFLKQLATDQELFQDLPLNVQQEVDLHPI